MNISEVHTPHVHLPRTSGHLPRGGNRFVVQEHHAHTDHFDFRLEKDGMLKSWALPKGPPENPGEKRLAIEVDDHPMEWADFEGVIAPGEYGAGTVRSWDHGTYVLHQWWPDKITFELHGSRLEGEYGLIRYPHSGANHWLLLKFHQRSM